MLPGAHQPDKPGRPEVRTFLPGREVPLPGWLGAVKTPGSYSGCALPPQLPELQEAMQNDVLLGAFGEEKWHRLLCRVGVTCRWVSIAGRVTLVRVSGQARERSTRWGWGTRRNSWGIVLVFIS